MLLLFALANEVVPLNDDALVITPCLTCDLFFSRRFLRNANGALRAAL